MKYQIGISHPFVDAHYYWSPANW